jgi:hypothetical protein
MAKKKQDDSKLQLKIEKAAADGKIRGSELRKLGMLYGQGDIARVLAPFALSNPNVSIGKGARKASGVRVKDGVATYTPTTYDTYYAGKLGTSTPSPNSSLFVNNSSGGYTYMGGKQAPMQMPTAEEPTTDPSSVTPSVYSPTPLADAQSGYGSGGSTAPDPAPSPSQFLPGGMGSSVDSGATGFRRKKSSARSAGLTTKGAARLRINPSFSSSSGLNIGI